MNVVAPGVFVGAALLLSSPAAAQSSPQDLGTQLAAARAELEVQRQALEAQEQRLQVLESQLRQVQQQQVASTPATAPPANSAAPGAATTTATARATTDRGVQTAGATPVPVEQVGEAPESVLMPTVAVLGMQGNVLTQAGG